MEQNDRRRVTIALTNDTRTIGPLITALAARRHETPHDVRTALITAAAQDSHAAQQAIVARSSALLEHQRRTLAAQGARDPCASASLIASVRWDDIPRHERETLLRAAAQHADAAQHAMNALLAEGTIADISHDLLMALTHAVPHTPYGVGRFIKAHATHWNDIPSDAQHALLQSAAQDAIAAQEALTELLPVDGALGDHWRKTLALSTACNTDAAAALIAALAQDWNDCPDHERNVLLNVAAPAAHAGAAGAHGAPARRRRAGRPLAEDADARDRKQRVGGCQLFQGWRPLP